MSDTLPGIPRHDHCDHPVQTFDGAMLPCAACSAPAPVLRWPVLQSSAARTFNEPLSPAMRTESVELYRMAASGVVWWARRPGDAMPLEVIAQLQFRRVERAYVDALAVLHDLGAERGAPWLAEAVAASGARWVPLVTQYRTALLRWLDAGVCPDCDRATSLEPHDRVCRVAALLRALGGDEETQRQVDAAREEATHEDMVLAQGASERARAASARYQVDTAPAMRVGDVTYQTSPFLGPGQAFVMQLRDFTPGPATQPPPVIVAGEPGAFRDAPFVAEPGDEPEEPVCGRCGGTGEDPEHDEPCGECQASE